MAPRKTIVPGLAELAKLQSPPRGGSTPTGPSSPTTTIPFDQWDKEVERLKKESYKQEATTTTTIPGSTKMPKVKLPKGARAPKANEIVPEGTIGISKEGNYLLANNKVVRKENFNPKKSPVLYNPGERTPKTTTKVKPVTPTTVPTVSEETKRAQEAYGTAAEGAANLGIPKEEKKKPGGWRGFLADVINVDVIPGGLEFKPVNTLIIKPLTVIDTGRRGFVSGFRESVDWAREKTGRGQVYTATDYIPTYTFDADTDKPIRIPLARVGDPVIDNVEEILATDIPRNKRGTTEVPSALTNKELQAAVDKVVKEKATTFSGNFSDWLKQTKDPTTGFGDIPYLQTNNLWVNRAIGFFGDVALDPTTYATLGGSAIVKPAVEGSKAAVKASARTAARVALEEAIAAGDNVAIRAAEKALAKAEKAAIAATPRRLHGATAREAAANTVREIRNEALDVVNDVTRSAAERAVAAKAVAVLTDELIGEIATKGYSVIKGAAAKELGVQGGLRFGLPGFNKVAVIPKITAPFTEAIGRATSLARLNFVNTAAGGAILQRITPLGEGGLFGAADILKMRTALRQGTVRGQEAADYVSMLSLDKLYRGQVNFYRKGVGQAVQSLTNDRNFKKAYKKLVPYLETPEVDWAAKGLPSLSTAERAVVKDIQDFFDALLDDANQQVKQLGGPGLTKAPNYFPHVQTREALTWGANNGDRLNKLAADLGVDRTALMQGNFMARNLKPGAIWFGKVLTDDDIAGGVKRLNQIAKESGKIKFNFFVEDLPTAIARYSENFAKFKAYAITILNAPVEAPDLAKFKSSFPVGTVTGFPAKPSTMGLTDVETRIVSLMDKDKLMNWSVAQIEDVKDRLVQLRDKLDDATIDKEEFEQAVLELDEYIVSIDRAILNKTITSPAAALLTHEAESYAIALATQIDSVIDKFVITSPSRWKMASPMISAFGQALNPRTIPDVVVRNEVLSFFRNAQRLDNPKFAQAVDLLLRDYTTFMKSYVTATPGFYIRNAIGNTFAMIAGGGNPVYLRKGMKYYKAILGQLKEGKSVDDAVGFVVAGLSPAEKQFVIESFGYSGTTGFGQIGEVAQAAGTGKAGIFGKEATGRIPLTGKSVGRVGIPAVTVPGAKKASETLFAPLRGLRNKGAKFEEATRFAMLYDGLRQGYDANTAAARANKYLIDYQDLTTLDKNIKQIIPFWMFFSRNLPLQIENMWMNPRAYQWYNSAKRNLEDREGTSENIPEYLTEAGAFRVNLGTSPLMGAIGAGAAGTLAGGAVGGIPGAILGGISAATVGGIVSDGGYLKPDLAFPGAGQPNVLQQIASGEAQQILSNVGTPFKLPAEIINNEKLYSGAPITDDRYTDEENARRKKQYILSNIVPALGTAGRWLSAVGGNKVPTSVQELTGVKLEKELESTLSLIGSPAFKLMESQERAAIWRKYFDLKEVIEADIKARTRLQRNKLGLLKDE